MVATSDEPDLERLRGWQAALTRQVEELRRDISAKQEDLAKVEERLSLVTQLVAVESRVNGGVGPADGPTPPEPALPASRVDSSRAAASPDLEQAVEKILRNSGVPMHISEIRASLTEQQVPIPGRGDDANIIVRLRRFEGRFTRTARGTYGLAEWGIPELASKTRKRRRTSAR